MNEFVFNEMYPYVGMTGFVILLILLVRAITDATDNKEQRTLIALFVGGMVFCAYDSVWGLINMGKISVPDSLLIHFDSIWMIFGAGLAVFWVAYTADQKAEHWMKPTFLKCFMSALLLVTIIVFSVNLSNNMLFSVKNGLVVFKIANYWIYSILYCYYVIPIFGSLLVMAKSNKKREIKSAFYVLFFSLVLQVAGAEQMWHMSEPFLTMGLVLAFLVIFTLKESAEKEYLLARSYQLKENRNVEIIEILTSDYSAAYYLDLDKDKVLAYRRNDELIDVFGEEIDDDVKYSARIAEFIDHFVYSNDIEMMKEATSIDRIKYELAKKKSHSIIFRYNMNGRPLYYEARIVKLGDGAPKACAFGILNVDEKIHREREQQLQLEEAKIAAEAANEAKSAFLFSMSHDIRTPLNAILGFNEMAEKKIDDKEKVLECLQKATLSGEHLLRILNDILDLAAIEKSKVNIELSQVDIEEAARASLMVVQNSAEERSLDLRFVIGQLDEKIVMADKAHVDQILLNILTNAIKYTKPGGVVTYSVSQIPCQNEGYGRFRFTVEDTGIGMSKAYLNSIYDAFSKETTSTLSGVDGIGLGMTLAQRLTKLLGGEIQVESDLGKGTKVTVELEFRYPNDELDGSLVNYDYVDLRGKRILMVEDNELNREIAKDLLSDEGILVEEAADGQEGLNKVTQAESGYYDAILMDIQMPIMDGYECTRAIRALSDLGKASVPIIAMTANAFDDDRKKSFESGMNEHLCKPVEAETLKKTLQKYCR